MACCKGRILRSRATGRGHEHGNNQVGYRCLSLRVPSVTLRPSCRRQAGFVAVVLGPRLTWGLTREEGSVNIKDVPPPQLCLACGTTPFGFWSPSPPRAVTLVSGWSVIGPSLLDNIPVTGITEETPEAGCASGNKYALCGDCFEGVTNRTQPLPAAAALLPAFLVCCASLQRDPVVTGAACCSAPSSLAGGLGGGRAPGVLGCPLPCSPKRLVSLLLALKFTERSWMSQQEFAASARQSKRDTFPQQRAAAAPWWRGTSWEGSASRVTLGFDAPSRCGFPLVLPGTVCRARAVS